MTYPKTLHHPGYDPGKKPVYQKLPNGADGPAVIENGTPCRFPPQSVNSQAEEDQLRAKGYRPQGEAAPQVEGYHEYPKMLTHPDHVPGSPDEIHAEPREEGKPLKTYVAKGNPEKFPPVTVNSLAEETAWNAKGYHMPVLADPLAFQKANAVPYGKGQAGAGYPRWEKGVLVQDPGLNTSGRQEYPKWLGDKLVDSYDEELALLGDAAEMTPARIESLISERRAASEADDEAAVDRIEDLLAAHGIEVRDRPHGTVWRRIDKAEAALAAADKHVDALPVEPPLPSDEAAERLKLVAEAAAKGIRIDKRWTNDKILDALTKPAA